MAIVGFTRVSLDDPVPPTTVRATLDRAGRLIAADRRLLSLNARAGGETGMPLAIPGLDTVVRLALQLAIPVARTVVVADGAEDLDLWVRADPITDPAGVRGGVDLILVGWRTRSPWQSDALHETREADFLRSAAQWEWETDAILSLTALSGKAGAAIGVDGQAVLGRPLTQLFVLAEDDAGVFPILRGLASRERFVRQRAIVRQTGQTVLLSAVPRLDTGGEFAGFAGYAEDVDPSNAARTGALSTSDVRSDLDALTDGIAARLDRTLRGPLDRIIASAETIRAQSDGPLRQDYADYAADIANAGRHLIGLVDDLIDLRAIEQPGFTVVRQPIDFAHVARQAAGLLRLRASSARVQIDVPAAAESLMATGDARRALQVLVNLLANAIRYSPLDGTIWIRAERDAHLAAIIVGDQGKGIALDDQARIFAKFERVDPGEAGGSGLGLYIARRLARAMGGDVRVDSGPGLGARFVFTLPLNG